MVPLELHIFLTGDGAQYYGTAAFAVPHVAQCIGSGLKAGSGDAFGCWIECANTAYCLCIVRIARLNTFIEVVIVDIFGNRG